MQVKQCQTVLKCVDSSLENQKGRTVKVKRFAQRKLLIILKMPQWLGISDMSSISHTLAKWELSFQHFSSIPLPFPGSCMLSKHWKDNSHLASVCEILDMHKTTELCGAHFSCGFHHQHILWWAQERESLTTTTTIDNVHMWPNTGLSVSLPSSHQPSGPTHPVSPVQPM